MVEALYVVMVGKREIKVAVNGQKKFRAIKNLRLTCCGVVREVEVLVPEKLKIDLVSVSCQRHGLAVPRAGDRSYVTGSIRG